jgi:hypothetical protein
VEAFRYEVELGISALFAKRKSLHQASAKSDIEATLRAKKGKKISSL